MCLLKQYALGDLSDVGEKVVANAKKYAGVLLNLVASLLPLVYKDGEPEDRTHYKSDPSKEEYINVYDLLKKII